MSTMVMTETENTAPLHLRNIPQATIPPDKDFEERDIPQEINTSSALLQSNDVMPALSKSMNEKNVSHRSSPIASINSMDAETSHWATLQNNPYHQKLSSGLSDKESLSMKRVNNANERQSPSIIISSTHTVDSWKGPISSEHISYPPMMLHKQPTMTSTPHSNTLITQGSIPNSISHSISQNSSSAFSSLAQPLANMTLDPSSVLPNGSYVADDVNRTPSMPRSRSYSHNRKTSLDMNVRLKVEKLEVALRYLGIEPSSQEQLQLRNRLDIDAAGTVSYGQFVKVARDLFRKQLEARNIRPGSLFMSVNDFREIETSKFSPQLSHISDSSVSEELERLRSERDDFRKENDRLKIKLKEQEKLCFKIEQELLAFRKESLAANQEIKNLRSKVHLAEEAQNEAMRVEKDYEIVVQLLEKEIAELKAQQKNTATPESPEVQSRVAILNSQLQKAEFGKKTYEVATKKLIDFAETVHASLIKSREVALTSNNDRHGLHGAIQTTHGIANDARSVVKNVNSLIEKDSLPYGWEEAYTADGAKYYINSRDNNVNNLESHQSNNFVVAPNHQSGASSANDRHKEFIIQATNVASAMTEIPNTFENSGPVPAPRNKTKHNARKRYTDASEQPSVYAPPSRFQYAPIPDSKVNNSTAVNRARVPLLIPEYDRRHFVKNKKHEKKSPEIFY